MSGLTYEHIGQALFVFFICFSVWLFYADPVHVDSAELVTESDIRPGGSAIVTYTGYKPKWAQKFCNPKAAGFQVTDPVHLQYHVPISAAPQNDGTKSTFTYQLDIPRTVNRGEAEIQLYVIYRCFGVVTKTYFAPKVAATILMSELEGGTGDE